MGSIVRTHTASPAPPDLFKGGGKSGVNFNCFHRRRQSEQLKKGGGSIVQGQVFLKGGAGTFPLFIIFN